MKRLLLLLAVCLGLFARESVACTSIIISGKATPDGRPLMWKHRDTEVPYNHIEFFDEGGYRFLGLVNSGDSTRAVWMGTNETGFSVMNTASYNLKDDDVKEMDQEGIVMRRALQICKTVDDFQHYLDTLARPMRVEANFGVIDANGGAAYFETNNTRYYKKDVNDPGLAPDGYLIYTNYSFEGRPNEGYGFIRYENAQKAFQAMRAEGFTPERIFQRVSRSYYNNLLDIDLMNPAQSPNNRTGWFVEQDFIPRGESTASIVIQGVKPGMNPELTTMWTALGYPSTAIAIPLWVKMGEEQPSLVTYRESLGTAPLCKYASRLKENVYPIHYGNGQKYLRWQLLWNDEGTGYIQKLRPVEERIAGKFTNHAAESKNKGLDTREIKRLYQETELLVNEAYTAYFTVE